MIARDVGGGKTWIDDAQIGMHDRGDGLGIRWRGHGQGSRERQSDVRSYCGTFPAQDAKHSISPDVKPVNRRCVRVACDMASRP